MTWYETAHCAVNVKKQRNHSGVNEMLILLPVPTALYSNSLANCRHIASYDVVNT